MNYVTRFDLNAFLHKHCSVFASAGVSVCCRAGLRCLLRVHQRNITPFIKTSLLMS